MGGALGFGGPSGDANSNGGSAITALGQQEVSGTAQSPQSLAQTSGSYGIGQNIEQLYGQSLQGGSPEQNYQNQGPLAQANYSQILSQAQNPLAGYQSALAPSLQQAQNSINEYYNSRGLDNSGIAIGAMGEAGVDLAIQNAQNEMTYQQQSLQNAGSLSQGINSMQNENISGLQGLYGTQQGVGVQQQQLANQGLESGLEMQAYPQQAALGSYYGGVAAQQALPGQMLGAGAQLGGDALMAMAMA